MKTAEYYKLKSIEKYGLPKINELYGIITEAGIITNGHFYDGWFYIGPKGRGRKPAALKATHWFEPIDLPDNIKPPEEFLTRGKGNFINCTDYDDAIQAIEKYHAQFVPSSIQEGMKEEAIGFVNWVHDNFYVRCIDGTFLNMNPHKPMDTKRYTLEQLYDLYQSQKQK